MPPFFWRHQMILLVSMNTKEGFAKDIICKNCGVTFVRRWSNNVFCKNKCNQQFQWRLHRSKTKKERERSIEKYHRLKLTLPFRFRACRDIARRRKREFAITFEQFKGIYRKPCFYCGLVFDVMGLDRIDSSRDYFIDNVCSACWHCNVAKSDMTVKDFVAMCHRVANKHDI